MQHVTYFSWLLQFSNHGYGAIQHETNDMLILFFNINFRFLRITKSDRSATLLRLVKLEVKKKRPIIVFGNKSVTSDYISIFLKDNGVNCINLNGDMLQVINLLQYVIYFLINRDKTPSFTILEN